MAKQQYVCNVCGEISSRWTGKCPSCGAWNSFIEEEVVTKSKKSVTVSNNKPKFIRDVEISKETRFEVGIGELDGVLGGGIVEGSLVLVGGDPGIGKSTLLLQMSASLVKRGYSVLYVSAEESSSQIRLRAKRLKVDNENVYLLTESNLENILAQAKTLKPDVMIIDSIQTIESSEIGSLAGSVSQVKEVTSSIMQFAKSNSIATFIVGHVTKTGNIAGPKLLEHLVDTVLYFEGDSDSMYRVLRGVKNRFGSTNEVGLFRMDEEGLVEVNNPSELFLSTSSEPQNGTAVFASIEGSRPLFIEIQSLLAETNLPSPRRNVIGMDYNQLNMYIAIMEKKLKMHLYNKDVYVNAVGGLKVKETAIGLAVALSICSSYYNKSIPNDTVIFGELGLLGEIRPVTHTSKRLLEASKLGYKKAIIPKLNKNIKIDGLEIVQVSHISQACSNLFGR